MHYSSNCRSIASFYNPSNAATISPAISTDGEAYPKYVFGDYMDVYDRIRGSIRSYH